MDRKEYERRKKASALSFEEKRDDDGNILNPEVVTATEQAKKNACDVNLIVAKAKKLGVKDPCYQGVPEVLCPQSKRMYGDFTSVEDFQTNQNRILKMNQEFMALPAKVRAKFDHDPSKFLAFLLDPKNKQECIDLGIIPKPVIVYKRELTASGEDLVKYENGVEVHREAVKAVVPPAPVAPGATV